MSILVGAMYGCGVEVVELNESKSSKRVESDQRVNSGDLSSEKGLYISIPLPETIAAEDVEVDTDLQEKIAETSFPRQSDSRIEIDVKCRGDREFPTVTPKPVSDVDGTSNEPALALSSLPVSLFKTTLTTFNTSGEVQKESVSRGIFCSGATVNLHIRDLNSNSKYQLSATYNDTFKMYEGSTRIFNLASAKQTVLVMKKQDEVETGDASIRVVFSDRGDVKPSPPRPIMPVPVPQPSPDLPTVCTNVFQWLYHPITYKAVAASNGCSLKELRSAGYLSGKELMEVLRKELEEGAICTQEAGQLAHPVSKELANYLNGCEKSILMKAGFTNQVSARMPGSEPIFEEVPEPVSN